MFDSKFVFCSLVEFFSSFFLVFIYFISFSTHWIVEHNQKKMVFPSPWLNVGEHVFTELPGTVLDTLWFCILGEWWILFDAQFWQNRCWWCLRRTLSFESIKKPGHLISPNRWYQKASNNFGFNLAGLRVPRPTHWSQFWIFVVAVGLKLLISDHKLINLCSIQSQLSHEINSKIRRFNVDHKRGIRLDYK